MLQLQFAFASKWTDRGMYDVSWYNASKSNFEISNAKQLAGIAFLVNNGYTTFSGKTIKLVEDISLKSNVWIPIGNTTYKFCGIFDGNNKDIRDLNINILSSESEHDIYGLFGYIKNAEIKDLYIYGDINFEIEDWYLKQYIGSISAYAEKSKLCNVKSYVDVVYDRRHASNYNYNIYIGGLIGYGESNYIERCRYNAKLDAAINKGTTLMDSEYYNDYSHFYVAGLCAYDKKSTYNYCESYIKDISMYLPGSKNGTMGISLGGIIAEALSSNIYSCKSVIFSGELLYYTNKIVTLPFGGITDFHTISYGEGNIHNCYCIIYDLNFGTGSSKSKVSCGNICRNRDEYNQQRYSNNYSNEDASFTVHSLPFTKGYDGLTTFNRREMFDQEFVDELNLYYTLRGKNPIWELGPYPYYPQVNLNLSTGIKNVDNKADSIFKIIAVR